MISLSFKFLFIFEFVDFKTLWVLKVSKMISVHSPLHKEVSKRQIESHPIWIPDHVWERYLDPIDKEIVYLLEDRYPYGYSTQEILKKLIEMEPEENGDYRLQDVRDALDISLKDYVVKKGQDFWVLKGKTPIATQRGERGFD